MKENDNNRLYPVRPSLSRNVRWIAAIALIYFATARLSLSFVIKPEGIAAIWPPEGVFLSAILLTRRAVRPYLVGVLLITDLVAEVLAGTPFPVSIAYAFALAGSASLSSWLLLRFVGGPITFRRVRDVFSFIVLAVLFINGVMSLVAAAASQFLPGASFWNSWKWWAASDGIGNLLVTPFIISWARPAKTRPGTWKPKRVLEGIALFVPFVILNAYGFIHLSDYGHFPLLLAYMTFPFLLWAALRFGVRGVTSAALLLAANAIYFTVERRITIVPPYAFPANAVILMQLYLALLAAPSLLLAALMAERKQSHEALSESERRYRAVFEQAAVGVARIDSITGRFLSVNRRYCELSGYSAEEMERSTSQDITHPDDLPAHLDNMKRLVSGQIREFAMEKRYRRKDGAIVWVYLTVSPLWTPGEAPRHHVAVVQDISERKRAEEELRQQREWLQVTLASIGDGVIACDTRGKVTFLNPVAQNLTAWPPEEAQDQPIANVFKIINELTRQPAEDIVGRALREKNVIGLANHTSLVTRDGRELPIEDSAAPILNVAGEVSGVVLVFHDVTQRRNAQDALRESERRFRTLANAIPQLTWIARPDGNISWYNQRWYDYTGTTPGQMEGWGWQRVHDPAVLPRVLEQWKSSLATGQPFDMTFPLRGADGVFRPFLTRVAPIRDDCGRIVQWFGTNTDVTEQKQAEETLREADRRKDEFLAMLAHELRNPLAPVRNAVQVMQIIGLKDPVLMRQRDIIGRQVMHMAHLVDDLLDVSRITRGRIELKTEILYLADALAQAVETVTPLVEARRQTLTLAMPPGNLRLKADPDRLVQIIGNLLANAAKYTGEDGRIWLEAGREGDAAVVRVRDTGVGIAPDVLPHVFELFIQADQGLARSQGGLGIGLTMVKRLTEMHGGGVEARSEGLGRGSEFIVRLPALPDEPPASARLGRSVNGMAASGSQRILVVDDIVDSAESLAEMLGLWGHEVRTAYCGPAALDLARDFHPGIVLLDIGMPEMDGFEVARRLRQAEGGDQLKLVALTGYARDDQRWGGRQAEFDHHLVKPVDVDALRALIQASAA